jgi:hypothetical protein
MPVRQIPLNAIIAPIDTSLSLNKSQNPTFLFKKQEVDRQKKRKRIFRIGLIAVASILLIYFLQGTIWLAIVPSAIFSFLKIRARIQNRPPAQYEEYDPLAYDSSYARKSVRRFVTGLIFTLLSVVTVIASIASELEALVVPFLGSYITGLIFFAAALIAVIKSFKRKEPFKSTATLILVLSLLFLLPVLTTPLAAIFGG